MATTSNILLVVAHTGFQPVEYAVPKKLLEQAGYNVLTASNQNGTATAKDETTTPVDLLIEQANPEDYDGVFFLGGPGALENLDNDASLRLIKKTVEAKKAIGAICISTRLLAKAGILKGKRATGWNGDDLLGSIYKEHEVHYIPNDVVVDDKIVTATGPNAAREFGERIIALLQD